MHDEDKEHILNTYNGPGCVLETNLTTLNKTAPSVGEWQNKQCYIQTMEYYSTLKRNELSPHKKTWRNFSCILLGKNVNLKRLPTV